MCVPHDDGDPHLVYLSKNLANKIVFCIPEIFRNGLIGSKYEERSLREGDFVMIERAPSLSKFNNQPFRLAFREIEGMGIHPEVLSYFHGAYDGDECHMNAIGNPKSVEEALMWKAPLDKTLCKAEEYMEREFPGVYEKDDRGGGLDSIQYNTLSFEGIREGRFALPMGD